MGWFNLYLLISLLTSIFYGIKMKVLLGMETWFAHLEEDAKDGDEKSENLLNYRNILNDNIIYSLMVIVLIFIGFTFPYSVPLYIYNNYIKKDDDEN